MKEIQVVKPKKRNKKIVVGVSGGVDSLISLILLKKAGWYPMAVFLRLPVWHSKGKSAGKNYNRSSQRINLLKKNCKKLDIPFFIVDAEKEFHKKVVHYFVSELRKGRTPNPCIICNRYLKFRELFRWAKEHKIKYVATGHYARIKKNRTDEKYELLRAKDKKKDQTYTLCLLPQRWLKNIIFPLGEYTKEEVYQMAKKEGFNDFLIGGESQDFCFLADAGLEKFLREEIGIRKGLIVDDKGRVLGEHQGLYFYTIGQRKNIRLPGGPYFVVGFDRRKNILKVSKNQTKLFKKEVMLHPFNFISGNVPKRKERVLAKIRYRSPFKKATLYPPSRKYLKIVFDKPQKAITPGQFCVFYRRNICLGGGMIN